MSAICHARMPARTKIQRPSLKPGVLKRGFFAVIFLVLLVMLGSSGLNTYRHFSNHEETDDAYITGHLHQTSTRIAGSVEQVLVDDNQHVEKGQLLLILDSRDQKVKVEQAKAELKRAQEQAAAARASISFQDTDARGQDKNAAGLIENALAEIKRQAAEVKEAESEILSAQSLLKAHEAELHKAALDAERYENLHKQGAVSTSEKDAARRDYLVQQANYDSAKTAVAKARAKREQANESVNLARAGLIQAEAQKQLARASALKTQVEENRYQSQLAEIEKAKAALDEALLNLSYSRIVAATSGRIGKKTVEAGQRIEPGQPLLTIVSDDQWIVANFKETQLRHMQSGQEVDIKIDSFPDHKFRGIVQSFSPASGASFALLPSDNATGNFTKIVQRIPVKILFTKSSIKNYESRLAPGMSVVASVSILRQS